MSDIELGPGKRARAAYSFDEIAIVPSRRTRDPEEVSISWQIDAYKFDLPFIAAPMDSVVSPATAIAIGKAGGLGVLNLEGIWTRYEDAEKQLADMAKLSEDKAIKKMQEIYAAPIQPTLIKERLAQIRAAGVTVAGALSPQRTAEFHKAVLVNTQPRFRQTIQLNHTHYLSGSKDRAQTNGTRAPHHIHGHSTREVISTDAVLRCQNLSIR